MNKILITLLSIVFNSCDTVSVNGSTAKNEIMNLKNVNEQCLEIAKAHMTAKNPARAAAGQEFIYKYEGIEKSLNLHKVYVISQRDIKTPIPGGDGTSCALMINIETGLVEKTFKFQ